MASPIHEEHSQSPNPTTSLISSHSPFRPHKKPKSLIILSSIIILCLAAAAAALAILRHRHHSVLPLPAVILLSFDGFRFGYHLKTHTPNIRRLIANGTSPDEGLIPVFPTLTFPNHYSIATGLFPPHHGIINNYFFDPHNSSDVFFTKNHDPKWWLGEPLWQTVARHGLNAAVIFWAGCEVKKASWSCPPEFCPAYNRSVSFEKRVDLALSYFDLPSDDIPALIMIYFEDPDSQGHVYGPDHPEITKAVARMDAVVGRLVDGLEKRGIFEEVTVILLGDHGMAGTCDEKYVFLDELSSWIEIESDWVKSADSLLTIRPPAGVSSEEVASRMNEGLSSGKVGNGDKLRVYLKEELPERFHYAASDRIPPIVGVVEEGYTVKYSREKRYECGGSHGYDNLLLSMRTFFVGHGPRFRKGWKIPSFQNVEVYNMITTILNLEGASNNGSALFPNSVLL